MNDGVIVENFVEFTITLLIASLRALTHEIARARTRMDGLDPDDEQCTEVGLYLQDLLMAQSLMADEYESRRGNEGAGDDFTEVDALLGHFSKERFV